MRRKELVLIVGVTAILLFAFSINADAGLISWWKFEGDRTDSHGTNDADGTYGDPSYTSDTPGGVSLQALALDGNDCVYDGNIADWIFADKTRTVEAWFKTDSEAEYKPLVYHHSTTWFLRTYPGGRLEFNYLSTNGNHCILRTVSSYNDGSWHHVAVTLGGGTGKLYIDGDGEIITDTYSGLEDREGTLQLGGINLVSGLVGTIDDVRIWDEVLSADDIKWNSDPDHAGQIIPEPSALLLLGAGLLGILAFRRKL